jgi:peptidoglycan hydrolase-like protein with peptidoglycan-binding domain
MHGTDVFALQRALRAAGYRKRKASINYGVRCRRSVRNFQRKHNLPVTGRLNQDTLDKLAKWYDGYGVYLIKQQQKRTARLREVSKVHKSVQTAFFLLAHKDATHYTQDASLRMSWLRDRIRPPKIPKWLDCSSACTWYRWVAGLSDPNGFNYNGTGYTGTMLAHGTRVTSPQEGDMTFYRGPDHVVIEVGQGRVISDGSDAGPYILSRGYRPVYQTRRYPN